ncbi:T9SS type A sorting domain-containing protein [Aequorivita sp. Q41]|uniref:T9SS type A sorting domain-containing protein n=1 Tax=Aequorivita sp. Q41 TaxID=3153300 RepID=UPI00324230DA
MKKITLILMFFGFLANAQINNYNVGDVVDDFTVTDTDGVEHNMYTITASGKHVWLDFFFVDCGPCQATASMFNEFYDKYGCNDGEVYALSINSGRDDDEYVKWYEQQYGGNFNHAPAASNEGGGGPVTSNFGVGAFPTYCLIGPDNKVILKDIYPIYSVQTFEDSFPAGFNPPVMQCTLGVSDSQTFDFNIYPSISKGAININLPSDATSTIAIFNALGQQVFKNTYSEKNINLNLQLSAGVYMVKVSADNASATKRIIIE